MPHTNNHQHPIRVLIIDDDEEDFIIINDLINDITEQKFVVDWCMNFEKGSVALSKATHDIYFIDYHLGPKTGIDLLKEAIYNKCEKPIILLTGQGNKNIDLEAMHLGAVDYLIKSQLSSEQLDRCIRYSLEQAMVLKKSKVNELKFQVIFERSKDVIFISNYQLEFQNVNNAVKELLGYEKDDLLDQNTAMIFYRKSERKKILKILNKEKKVIDYNVDFLTKQKTIKSCLFSASYEIDETGAPCVQGIIHDISILKKVDEIKAQSEMLEVKGEAIRMLAHEVRNPLANIILSTECLKNDTSVENREFLNIIRRNSKRINDLINELLDSNQYHKLKLEIVPLQKVLDQAVQEASDRIELKKVKVNVDYPDTEALALIDENKLRLALLNIIVNAIEAMSDGKGELSISLQSQWNFHTIKIKDNGSGISAENITNLFQPYFTTKTTGLGLGLAATNAILQSHKAEAEVTSSLGIGTTFTIKIPSL